MNSVQISPEDILIRAQETPNPNAIKFIINHGIIEQGKATFQESHEAENIPLARDMFHILGVGQVYFFENTITVTQDGRWSFEELESQVSSVIKTRLPSHDTHFEVNNQGSNYSKPVDRSTLSPELQEIEEILDRTIRPGLQADGGDVEVISLNNNELLISYQGACGGCPSSMMGTLDAIQGILRQELNNPELTVSPLGEMGMPYW